jgi:8-oxo-dGTP diphosphatase
VTGRLRVVAAAVIDNGRVLAARRSRPPALAGRWEFAGGKVETGETDADALRRELREELGVGIRVHEPIGVASDHRIELRLYRATLDALDSAHPAAQDDHDELRWVGPLQIGELAWLPIDRQLIDSVVELLTDP